MSHGLGLILGTLLLVCNAAWGKPYTPDPIHDSWTPPQTTTAALFEDHDAYHSYDAKTYDLNIAFDPKLGTLSGTNIIEFQVTGTRLSTLEVDAVNMDIHDVRWHDQSPLLFTYDQRLLRVTLPYELTEGARGSVKISFDARRPESLHVSGPDASRPERVNSAYTYTQPNGTRRWFPCHDIPSNKTITDLNIIVPAGYNVASNGRESPGKPLSDGRISFAFKSEVNIASYLTSVVLGPMESEQIASNRNVPLLISGPSYYMPALRKETARTAHMMQVFEQFTQTQYPFNKYRQTVAEGYNASMEHQSATSMGGRRIVGDGSGEGVIAHELAHQWFGDLVTCGVWGDMWLNEGFATYLPIVFFKAAGSHDNALSSLLDSREWYLSETNLGNARPLSTPEEWPSYDIFDQHSYAKGALVIHLMRTIANTTSAPSADGKEPFSKALGIYLRDKAYGNVRYFHLQRALETATGDSWDKFFKEWILQAGHPEISATWEQRRGVLSIALEQTQATRQEKPWGTFSFPLTIAVIAEDGTSTVHRTWIDDAHQSVSIPTSKLVKAIVLDPSLTIPGTFTVQQDIAAWKSAFFATKDPYAQSVVLTALFAQFTDAELSSLMSEIVTNRALSATTLALLAGFVEGRDGLLREAMMIARSPLRRQASLVLLGRFSSLDTWIISKLPAKDRPTFESLEATWRATRRVEEREAILNAMLLVDIEKAHRLAVRELNNQRWTDRDRIAFVKTASTKVSRVSKPVIFDLLANHHANNIRFFMDQLYQDKFSDPEILPLLKSGALTHRASAARVKYVKLISLQKSRQTEACDALATIRMETKKTGTTDDRAAVLSAVEASWAELACR